MRALPGRLPVFYRDERCEALEKKLRYMRQLPIENGRRPGMLPVLSRVRTRRTGKIPALPFEKFSVRVEAGRFAEATADRP